MQINTAFRDVHIFQKKMIYNNRLFINPFKNCKSKSKHVQKILDTIIIYLNAVPLTPNMKLHKPTEYK